MPRVRSLFSSLSSSEPLLPRMLWQGLRLTRAAYSPFMQMKQHFPARILWNLLRVLSHFYCVFVKAVLHRVSPSFSRAQSSRTASICSEEAQLISSSSHVPRSTSLEPRHSSSGTFRASGVLLIWLMCEAPDTPDESSLEAQKPLYSTGDPRDSC